MKIVNHKLEGEGLQPFQQTPNVGGVINADTIIIHYTAGSNAESAIRTMMNPEHQASAHLCVGRDGKTTQLADFNIRTNHAGRSAYGGRKWFNNLSIGIEIDNPGFLEKKGDKYYTYWGKEIAKEDVFEGDHWNKEVTPQRYWHKYPESQIQIVFDICKAICDVYDIQYILGHDEIGVYKNGKLGRKQDPGPAFPIDDFRKKLIKNNTFDNQFGTATAKVNVRETASANAEKVAEALELNEKVQVIKELGSWYRIKMTIDGWVARKYLKQDNSNEDYDATVDADTLNIRSAPGGDKVAKALKRKQPVDILEDKGEWCKVETYKLGWVAKEYINLEKA